MRAEIVTIGSELLLGQTVDTNATKLAQMLHEIGVEVLYKTSVGDNEARITEVLQAALNRVDLIITSGGLGPTVDDITRQAVANATGRPLVYDEQLEAQIAARFRSFGRTMSENNKQQAYIPQGAQPLLNSVGTAPCFLAEDSAGRGAIISLPGVPRELRHMMTNTVVPLLRERMGETRIIKIRVLRTCAVGESRIDQAIGDLMTTENPVVGLAAHGGQTDIRITAKAETEAAAHALIAPMEAELRERLGVAIYGVDQETVPEVVGQLLTEKGLKLGMVDTVTKGHLRQWLVDAGFEGVLSQTYQTNLAETVAQFDLSMADSPALLTTKLAAEVAPPQGVGLAVAGPFAENNLFICVRGPEDFIQVWPLQNYEWNTYRRRWLIVQSFDWLRRAVLGQLESPVD